MSSPKERASQSKDVTMENCDEKPKETTDNKKYLDLVFTMDCTGSMGTYIDAAKSNIQSIVQKLSSTENIDLRFGLVAYRDHPPQDTSFVTKTFAFTDQVNVMQSYLNNLTADGGGDGPEAVEAGLEETLNMEWREDATKVCVLIADAPPHGLGEMGDGFPNGAPTGVDPIEVLERMSSRGVCVYSVGCQPALSSYRFAVDFLIGASEKTNGQAIGLDSAAGLADVILGGSIEECDLQELMKDMKEIAREARRADPRLDDEGVQQKIYDTYQTLGVQTRQMQAPMMKSPFSTLVSGSSTLKEAKTSLGSAAPAPSSSSFEAAPTPYSYGGGGGGWSIFGSSKTGTRKAKGAGKAEGARASSSSVQLEKDYISHSQVSRMYGRAKKMGDI